MKTHRNFYNKIFKKIAEKFNKNKDSEIVLTLNKEQSQIFNNIFEMKLALQDREFTNEDILNEMILNEWSKYKIIYERFDYILKNFDVEVSTFLKWRFLNLNLKRTHPVLTTFNDSVDNNKKIKDIINNFKISKELFGSIEEKIDNEEDIFDFENLFMDDEEFDDIKNETIDKIKNEKF